MIPLVAAPVSLILGRRQERLRELFALASALATFVVALALIPEVRRGAIHYPLGEMFGIKGLEISLHLDHLGLFMLGLISFLGLLATLYSLTYMKKYKGRGRYYFFLLIFIGAMNGTVSAGDLISFFFFWELMTISSFLLVIFDGSAGARKAGLKYLIMTAASALLMLFSLASIYALSGTVSIRELMNGGMGAAGGFTHLVLFFFLIGLGVKAGMAPLHTWLPGAHPAAPSPVSSLLSGVMIKVGIYMMVRVFFQIFFLALPWNLMISLLGALTLLTGNMLALVERDAKRLLAYSSIGQMGYIMLAIGIGTTLGMAGALFHLMNHAFFKGLLFLGIGVVIYRVGEKNLEKLGGLARVMPLTFITCLVASLAISGVPPLNGFVSKWIIYQALIEQATPLSITFLVVAILGSVLTLASFMKLIYATFLAPAPGSRRLGPGKISWTMGLPLIILAGLCILGGIFAQFPLRYLIGPMVGREFGLGTIEILGFFNPTLAGGLIILGLVVGAIIYLLGNIKTTRTTAAFIGGELLERETMRVTGVDFYNTIKTIRPLAYLYRKEAAGQLDPYPVAQKGLGGLARVVSLYLEPSVDKFYEIANSRKDAFTAFLKRIHSGILSTYIFWCLAGLVILLILLLR